MTRVYRIVKIFRLMKFAKLVRQSEMIINFIEAM